jgi:hypothetical protein
MSFQLILCDESRGAIFAYKRFHVPMQFLVKRQSGFVGKLLKALHALMLLHRQVSDFVSFEFRYRLPFLTTLFADVRFIRGMLSFVSIQFADVHVDLVASGIFTRVSIKQLKYRLFKINRLKEAYFNFGLCLFM